MPRLPELLEVLDRFLEAMRDVRRRRALKPLEEKLERALRRAFRAQGAAFLRRFERLKDRFPTVEESIRGSDWEPLFTRAALETLRVFADPIDDVAGQALLAGAGRMIAEIGLPLRFDLKNPRAVTFLKHYGADRVTRINETTRHIIRGIVVEGAEQGWSYDKTARAISGRFTEFAVGKPQLHIASRAHLVAVTEVANADEEGNRIVAQDLAAAGLEMEKHWQDSEDDRVSDGCRENTAAGWIPLDDAFPSGDQRVPRFPGCRCFMKYRRKKE